MNLQQKIKSLKWDIYNKLGGTLTVSTEWFKIKLSAKDEALSKEIYFTGEYSFGEIDKAINYLKQAQLFTSGTLLDIGANIGHVTLYCLARNYASKAICFEPDDFNFSLLTDNLELNNLNSKTTTVKLALGSKSGKEKIILSKNNYGDHRIFTNNEVESEDKYNAGDVRAVADIEIVTLDEYIQKNKLNGQISAVSLDVQGFEYEILKGGRTFFKTGVPLMMEVDPYLLEKKNCTADMLYVELSASYSHFLDLHHTPEKLHPISEFTSVYNAIKSSNKDYTDMMFFNAKN
jgi:FkbM family methyltransferase